MGILTRATILVTTVSSMLTIAAGCGGTGGSGDINQSGVDAGTADIEGGANADSGPTRDGATTSRDDAGRKCVTVDISSYSTACSSDSDCVAINRGPLCENGCACGATDAIASSEMPRYRAAVSGVQTMACPCAAPDVARCVNQNCTLCPRAGGAECGDQ